jgi:hypothetical protein
VNDKQDTTRSLGNRAARFCVMSAAIIVVSLVSAALFEALAPADHLATTGFLPHLAIWMAGAFVGLAAGIAALFKAGTHR